jgi:hypothetical protein
VFLRGLTKRSDARGQSIVEFALLAPLMIFILFAILDLSRIYTAMASVESAAREAADYSTSFGAERWSDTNLANTVAEMKRRACTAASDLHDYEGIDNTLPLDGIDDDCVNPSFDYCVTQTAGSCGSVDTTDPAYTCDDPDRDPPCTVTVTMSHVFHLFVPFQMDFFGVRLGLPVTLAFDRDSTFAMTDIDVAESASP